MNVADADLDELLALNRALMEARYHEDPYDECVLASPIVAQIHVDVIEAIIGRYERDAQRGHSGRWREWRAWATGTREHEIVVQRLAALGTAWSDRDADAKLDTVYYCVAPFEATDEELRDLVREIDGAAVRGVGSDGRADAADPV